MRMARPSNPSNPFRTLSPARTFFFFFFHTRESSKISSTRSNKSPRLRRKEDHRSWARSLILSVGQVNSITLAYVTPTTHRIYFEPYIYIYIKPAKFLEQREEEIRMQHQNAFERKLDGKLEEYVYTSSSLSSAKNLSLFSLSSPLYTLYFWRNSVYPPPIRERTLPSLPPSIHRFFSPWTSLPLPLSIRLTAIRSTLSIWSPCPPLLPAHPRLIRVARYSQRRNERIRQRETGPRWFERPVVARESTVADARQKLG